MMALVSACGGESRGRLEEDVSKIICLQDALLYKAIKLSVSKNSASRIQPLFVTDEIHFSCLFASL